MAELVRLSLVALGREGALGEVVLSLAHRAASTQPQSAHVELERLEGTQTTWSVAL